MDNKTNEEINQLACLFWKAFAVREPVLKELIFKRTPKDNQTARGIIDNIATEFGIKDSIGIIFGVDIRNGVKLPERKNHIELLFSPLYQRKNKKIICAIYNAHKPYLPNYWSVIKYRVRQSEHIDSITVNFRDESDPLNIIEVSKVDFSYYPILDPKNNQFSIILFVNDDKAKYLIKKEKYEIKDEMREIWIPKNYTLYAMLDSAMGEYHLLNTLNKMEIYLDSEEREISERQPIEKIASVVEMIANNPMSGIHNCSRCNYPSTQTRLGICKCKKVYYCDSICQRAHRKLHKLNC
jgi:hypothetical protein